MAQATARLRKTFRYPEDKDIDENEPAEGIDEQEQERIVASLSTRDHKSTALYRRIFLAVPLFTLSYYLSALGPVALGIYPNAHPFLWISSVLSSTLSFFLVWDVHIPGDSNSESKPRSAVLGQLGRAEHHRSGDNPIGPFMNEHDAFARWVEWARRRAAWIDGIISTVVFAGAWWVASSADVRPGEISSAWIMALPALLTFLVATVAQHELQPIDVRGLQQLKYEYKGA